ncbi:MAG: glycerol kinase GlpK [Planctomycetes bacterium]|nr:glycerol kinase GlpK [Planctomycetota bacterium]
MFLALDQGTTSSRAIAFDRDGAVLGTGQREFPQHFPAPGWVEHDPERILQSQTDAALAAVAAAGGGPVEAVGLANQRETVVVFDRRTGRPIHRAIVWQDRRTADRLEALRAAGHEDFVRERTGLPLDPYFSAAKIAWILDHVPGARAAAARGELGAGTIDTWLLFRLTGGAVFATDASNAARTSLYDLRRGAFDDELCRLFDVPRACLPEVRPSAGDFGVWQPHGWPLRAVLGDQQAALFAHGCLSPGQAKCTYGTGAFVLQNAGSTPPAPAPGVLATVAWRLGGATTFAHEGSVLVCGAAIQWLRDQLGIVRTSAEVEALARSVADSGDVVFVPAFAGLGTPHWDPRARGLLIGLSRGTSRAHVVRAAVEAMALQVDDVLAAMRGGPAAAAAAAAPLAVDGGAAANGLLLEIQASLRGGPVVRPALLEATAFGAFRMGLLGAGVVADPTRLPALPGTPLVVSPTLSAAAVDGLRRRWRAAVERARGWA